MLDQVRQFIEEHTLFNLTTDPVLVAVSGGLDSVVLLDVLHRLGVPVAVAHCHFGLRGEEVNILITNLLSGYKPAAPVVTAEAAASGWRQNRLGVR